MERSREDIRASVRLPEHLPRRDAVRARGHRGGRGRRRGRFPRAGRARRRVLPEGAAGNQLLRARMERQRDGGGRTPFLDAARRPGARVLVRPRHRHGAQGACARQEELGGPDHELHRASAVRRPRAQGQGPQVPQGAPVAATRSRHHERDTVRGGSPRGASVRVGGRGAQLRHVAGRTSPLLLRRSAGRREAA